MFKVRPRVALLSAPTARRIAAESDAGKETPKEVLEVLAEAYGEDVIDETGLETMGHSLEDCMVNPNTHNLTYGELLTAGVSKALGADRLDLRNPNTKVALELGMGTGKVALQCFLECPNLERVIGIELVPGRYMQAENALFRLANSGRYQLDSQTQRLKEKCTVLSRNMSRCAILSEGSRKLEIYCGDMMSLPVEVVAAADVIFAQVVLPPEAQTILQGLLSHAKNGCRAFLYNDLMSSWQREKPSHFHRMKANMTVGEYSDVYATSWLPRGRKFFIFTADSTVTPTITKDGALKIKQSEERMKALFGLQSPHWLVLILVAIILSAVAFLGWAGPKLER